MAFNNCIPFTYAKGGYFYFVRRVPSNIAARYGTSRGRCCRTLSAMDSHRESMRLDGLHEQAIAWPLPHDELVQLQYCAKKARVVVDLAGQEDDLAFAA